MARELILSGSISCEYMSNDELAEQVYKKILSPLYCVCDADCIEIYFGNRLYRKLCNADIIEHNTSTINRVYACSVDYSIASFKYYVYKKCDHEDQIDVMTAWFQSDIKRQLNAAFGTSSIPIDISGKIKNVIFNPPATIIFWKDGSKTVVKCDGEAFDPEKGMAMAISRKVLGDSYEYYNVFEKWCKKYKHPEVKSGKYPWGVTPQEVAAKYMPLPKTESGDSNAD